MLLELGTGIAFLIISIIIVLIFTAIVAIVFAVIGVMILVDWVRSLLIKRLRAKKERKNQS